LNYFIQLEREEQSLKYDQNIIIIPSSFLFLTLLDIDEFIYTLGDALGLLLLLDRPLNSGLAFFFDDDL
jgi:hypothetical protein